MGVPGRGWWAALLALTLVRFVVAATMPISPDEAYYWVWSHSLQAGYLDHPPMVALWIWLGRHVAPGTLGVRLLAPLAAALGTVLIVDAGRVLRPGGRVGLIAAVLLNATLLLGAGAVTMTPDTPLLLFWTVALWAMVRLATGGQARWWLVAGLAVGLATDSKYSAALFPMAIGAWLLLTPAMRGWLRRPAPYGGALLAGLVFTPPIVWNWRHGWASFVRQGGRTGDWHPARAAQYLLELLAGQIGLFTPIIFVLCMMGTWRALRHGRAPESGLLAALVLLPGLIFVQHALGDRVQANWPGVIAPAACLAAALWTPRGWRAAAGFGFALTALVTLQAVVAPWHLPARWDVTLLRLGGWQGWADQVGQARAAMGAAYVASESYGDASLLAWYGVGAPVVGIDPRWRFFDLPRSGLRSSGLLVCDARHTNGATSLHWTNLILGGDIARERRGMIAQQFTIYHVPAQPVSISSAILPQQN